MHGHASLADGAFSEKSVSNHLIDYSSDCEKNAEFDSSKYSAEELDQCSALKKLRGPKVQTSSASVSDNWGSLQVQKPFLGSLSQPLHNCVRIAFWRRIFW